MGGLIGDFQDQFGGPRVATQPPPVDRFNANVDAGGFRLQFVPGDAVNLLDYAQRDTGTDQAEAIQEAINAAAGRTLYIPKGVWSTGSGLALLDDTAIVAEPGATIKLILPLTETGVLYGHETDNWWIQGLTIDMDSITNTAIEARRCNKWRVIGCSILNIKEYGIFVNGGSYWRFKDNYITKVTPTGTYQNQAIIVSTSGDDVGYARIEGNHCVNSGLLLSGHDYVIDGNSVTGTGYGSGIALLADANSYHNRVINNSCSGGRGTDVNATIVTGYEMWSEDSYIGGNQAFDNDGTGFDIGTKNSIIIGNHAKNNGRLADGDGFVARYGDSTYNASHTLWIGNRAYDSAGAGGHQSVGYHDQSDHLEYIVQIGNDWNGNKDGHSTTLGIYGQDNAPRLSRVIEDVSFGAISDGDDAQQGGLFSIAQFGDRVEVAISEDTKGCELRAWVESSNSVRVRILNDTGSTQTIGTVDVYLTVIKKRDTGNY